VGIVGLNPGLTPRAKVETEIGPLLDEYWYDAPETAKAARAKLLARLGAAGRAPDRSHPGSKPLAPDALTPRTSRESGALSTQSWTTTSTICRI